MFLSIVSVTTFFFKIHTLLSSAILNRQIFILSLHWTKDLHLKICRFFENIIRKLCFWIKHGMDKGDPNMTWLLKSKIIYFYFVQTCLTFFEVKKWGYEVGLWSLRLFSTFTSFVPWTKWNTRVCVKNLWSNFNALCSCQSQQ